MYNQFDLYYTNIIIKQIGIMNYKIKYKGDWKYLISAKYNYAFNMSNGFMAEWGETTSDNPTWCPFGPIILDIEVSTICKGPNNKPCPFCYKSNTVNGYNMSFDRFKEILDVMPDTLTQCAFGADAQCESNPNIWKMMDYCRTKKIIPNITVADISTDTANKLVDKCGAVAVSAYNHAGFDVCFDSIDRLTKSVLNKRFNNESVSQTTFRENGMQINIHYMISEQTGEGAMKLMTALKTDPRLKYVNAIVFLHLKKKGRGESYDIISNEMYNKIVDYAMDHSISIGFDTCGANKFMNYAITNRTSDEIDQLKICVESCCAGRLSCYVNEYGEYYPCSFMEGTIGDWNKGILISSSTSFCDDIWYNNKVAKFGRLAINCVKENKGCPYWDV